jgi:UDP-N-acetylglucosamine pyrophosphorylase
MKSDLPKVLHKINDRPMVHYVIDLAKELNAEKTILIIGHERELVKTACAGLPVEFAVQEPQLGTGHAVQMTEKMLSDFDGDILVLSGDVPLLTAQTMNALIQVHSQNDAAATLLTSDLDDPTGYGRVMRDADGSVYKIVEHKDANERERAVREINAGIYIFKAADLFRALKMVKNDNAQGEYYLPDVISIFISENKKVFAVKTDSFDETRGINTIEQLKEAETILTQRR